MATSQSLQDAVREAHDRAEVLRQRSAEAIQTAEAILERMRRGDRVSDTAALRAEVEGLRKALETRPTIEQAKGIIIARTGCTPDAAFEILVRQSQHENRKLREVAEHLVQAAVRPSRKA